jgi:short-subunit dehydrogenase
VHRFGPWALVTGASSGIGYAFARELASRGLNLVIVARRLRLLESFAGELRHRYGVQVQAIGLDLARPDFLEPILDTCADKDVGLVVSNAGFGLKGEHHTLVRERLSAMLAVNCHAPLLLAHAFAPRLIERRRGGIVFTGSIEGFQGFPFSSGYAATKAFVTVLGEGLWGELRGHGVDVLVLSPGATDTAAPTLQGVDKARIVGPMMAPETVAAQALARLGGAPVFIPGLFNRLVMRLLRALPRRLSVRLAGKGIRDSLQLPAPDSYPRSATSRRNQWRVAPPSGVTWSVRPSALRSCTRRPNSPAMASRRGVGSLRSSASRCSTKARRASCWGRKLAPRVMAASTWSARLETSASLNLVIPHPSVPRTATHPKHL